MATGEDYPPTRWVVDSRLGYVVRMGNCIVSSTGHGDESGKSMRLYLTSSIVGELIILHPHGDGDKLDPTEVKGLTLPFKPVGFFCSETGCIGIITNDRRFSIPIQTSCTGSSLSAMCPVCGRLHWLESGKPVQNPSCEKVFCINGRLENRPLESSGRLTTTREFLDGAEKKGLDQSYFHDQLTYLANLGHASDCPAATGAGNCACGVVEAKQWLADHQFEEEIE